MLQLLEKEVPYSKTYISIFWTTISTFYLVEYGWSLLLHRLFVMLIASVNVKIKR